MDLNEFKEYIESKYDVCGFSPINDGLFHTEFLYAKYGTIADGWWITYKTSYLTVNLIIYFVNKDEHKLLFAINNEIKTYEIWSEGHCSTGYDEKTTFHGTSTGHTFREAAINLLGEKIDPNKLSIYGCALFDNEIDARKSFG